MKYAAFAIVALLLAVPSEATIITSCGKVCEEVMVLVPPPPSTGIDPGWEAFQGSAEEKLAAQLADLLHEPPPEWALTLVCTMPPGKLPPMVPPGKPGHPGMPPDGPGGPHEPPDGPHRPPGGDGGGGHPVPEPSMVIMGCLGLASLALRITPRRGVR